MKATKRQAELITPTSAELVIMPTEISHLAELAKDMRKEDADEIMASGGYSPLEGLRAGFWNSDFCSTGFLFGDMVAIFGILRKGSALAGTNIAWLLTGYGVEKHPIAFFKGCKIVIEDLLQTYPTLVNMIDARHTRALSWARHLGAELGEPVPFGMARLPFRKMTLRRIQCVNLSPYQLRRDWRLRAR